MVVSNFPTTDVVEDVLLTVLSVLLGKSDPYTVFTLNGQKVFKSEVVKKTVNPVWNNQSFVTLVVSGRV